MDLKGKKMSALSVQDLAQASSVRCLICKKGPTAQVSASCNVWFSVQVISSLTTFWILVTKSNHSIKLYVKCWKVTTYNYCSLQGQLSHGTTYHLLLKQAVCQNKLVVHLCMQIAGICLYYIILLLFLSFIHVCNSIKGSFQLGPTSLTSF